MNKVLQVSRHTRDGVVILSLTGLMNREGVPELKSLLDPIIVEGPRGVLLDFTQVQGIDYNGLGYLLSAYGRAQQKGLPFKLTCLHPRVARAFLDVKLNLIFEMFDSIETALKTYKRKC